MSSKTISIFGNKIFLEILKEIKLFSSFKIKYYEDIDICIKDSDSNIDDKLIIFFVTSSNKKLYEKIKINSIPVIAISSSPILRNLKFDQLKEKINMPFSILNLQKKIITLLAKCEFQRNSLIYLHDYTIDKNERKIKKNGIELKLSEKEVNFLILFSKEKKPIDRKLVLKDVWNYSPDTDTHTVETHIYRLRKKISDKFLDEKFILNNKKGYYL